MAGRRAVLVIAPERFRDEELAAPRAALERAGHAVTVASTRTGTASGMLGAKENVTTTVADVRAEDCDLLAVVGGAGSPDHLWDHEPLRRLVVAIHAAGKPLGAICLSPPVLARAGVLAGKRATTYPAERAIAELKRGGAEYVREPVVEDGIVITASGPEAAAAFGQALITRLGT
jgi:deglycase